MSLATMNTHMKKVYELRMALVAAEKQLLEYLNHCDPMGYQLGSEDHGGLGITIAMVNDQLTSVGLQLEPLHIRITNGRVQR